jgi:serine protease Do
MSFFPRISRFGVLAIATITVMAALAAACSSGPRATPALRPAPSYKELKMEELRDLERSDPSRVLEAISSLLEADESSSSGPSVTELTSLATEAIAALEAAYDGALAAKDYPTAIDKLDCLHAVAGTYSLKSLLSAHATAEVAAWKARRAAYLASEADAFFEKEQTAPALLVYVAALAESGGDASAAPFSDDRLELWAKRALEARDRASFKRLCAELAIRSLALPPGAESYLDSKDSMEAMRKGVVTIRVDKGIKIEQGVGVPDRELGSAFFIDRAGYAITNYHVIESEVDPTYEGYSRISAKPADVPEDRLGAKVIGYDRLLDLALVKVDTVPEYVFSLSEGIQLSVGHKIYAIGSPAGLENTVTSGIVSAQGRKILQTGSSIQVDVALNPGNSGGPLLDESGDVVGVVYAGMLQYQGLNFAIPSEWVLKVLPDLFRGGEVKRAWLGLCLAENESGPRKAGIEITYRHPAVAAGIDEGDRILALDGTKLKDIPSTQALLLRSNPGVLSLVSVERGGVERTLLRSLGERPFTPFESAARLDRKEKLFPPLFGMSLTPLPSSLFDSASFSVAKIWPGSIADESGLSENDPISLRRFVVDRAQHAAYIQIYVKKRKAGFLESVIQIPASLDTPDFI